MNNIRCLDCGQSYIEWQDRCDLCDGLVSVYAGTVYAKSAWVGGS